MTRGIGRKHIAIAGTSTDAPIIMTMNADLEMTIKRTNIALVIRGTRTLIGINQLDMVVMNPTVADALVQTTRILIPRIVHIITITPDAPIHGANMIIITGHPADTGMRRSTETSSSLGSY